MKIALINPSPVLKKNEQYYGQKWPPLGILLLGTILKNQGHQVKLLDQASNGYSFDEVLNWIKKNKARSNWDICYDCRIFILN